ncbi:hypothetical protein [Raineyella fluvialis]|uniref:Uncharacterized protein n=1 Tax=Raineyella fluvialis TaxID=2662261 RepID=A0A5Q2FD34_9ACTN|nr:hypothetical protein [Raineyella fluvialis]QGF22615.1 hypothetical protein Rai3103_01775 [Raineyella fluvialis]
MHVRVHGRRRRLDAWEEWRRTYEERAEALAQGLAIEQIAGLMLIRSHERFPEAGLTDTEPTYSANDQLRNVLNAGSNNVNANVAWEQPDAGVRGVPRRRGPVVRTGELQLRPARDRRVRRHLQPCGGVGSA